MLKKEETKLEIFGFDDEKADDNFYCLVNIKKNPDGIDLKALSMSDPRNFDEELNSQGCILLLRGDEVEELINRGELNDTDLHKSLFELAVKEEIIQ